MGFLDLNVKCAICDKIVVVNYYKLSRNELICSGCLKKIRWYSEFEKFKKVNYK